MLPLVTEKPAFSEVTLRASAGQGIVRLDTVSLSVACEYYLGKIASFGVSTPERLPIFALIITAGRGCGYRQRPPNKDFGSRWW